MSALYRWVGLALLVTAVAIVVVALHVRRRGETSLAASDRAQAAGDIPEAIAWARDAAMCVGPGSTTPDVAFGRLADIAGRAEERGDFAQATTAWRAVWTAIQATRAEAQEAARRDEAAKALVRLAAKTCEGDQTRPPATCAAAAEAALHDATLPELPKFQWLALGGVLVFGGGVAASRTRGTSRAFALAVSVVGVALAALALVTR